LMENDRVLILSCVFSSSSLFFLSFLLFLPRAIG
jgi:hypothetical protein